MRLDFTGIFNRVALTIIVDTEEDSAYHIVDTEELNLEQANGEMSQDTWDSLVLIKFDTLEQAIAFCSKEDRLAQDTALEMYHESKWQA